MTIKVLIKRKFRDGNVKESSKMLVQARHNAMKEKGYISSETLRGCDDPNEIMVLSMWQKKEDWDRYKDSPDRQELERMFAELLEEQTESRTYEMGMGSP